MLGMNNAGLYRYLRVFESDQHGTFCGRWGCPHLTHLACARLYTRLAPEAHDTMNTLLVLNQALHHVPHQPHNTHPVLLHQHPLACDAADVTD